MNELLNPNYEACKLFVVDELDPKIEADKPYIVAIREAFPQRVSEAEAKQTVTAPQ